MIPCGRNVRFFCCCWRALFSAVGTQLFDASPKIVTVSRGEKLCSSQSMHLHRRAFSLIRRCSESAEKFSAMPERSRSGNTVFKAASRTGKFSMPSAPGTSTANPSVTIYEGLRGTQIAKNSETGSRNRFREIGPAVRRHVAYPSEAIMELLRWRVSACPRLMSSTGRSMKRRSCATCSQNSENFFPTACSSKPGR